MPRTPGEQTIIVRAEDADERATAKRINQRERNKAVDIVEHAIAQGKELAKMRDRLGPRKFRPWFAKHVKLSRRTIYRYIKLYENRQAIGTSGIPITTITDALNYILPAEDGSDEEGTLLSPEGENEMEVINAPMTEKEMKSVRQIQSSYHTPNRRPAGKNHAAPPPPDPKREEDNEEDTPPPPPTPPRRPSPKAPAPPPRCCPTCGRPLDQA